MNKQNKNIMTQEDKELLFKDLCARWPYGVKVNNEIQGDFEIYGICGNYIFARTSTSHVDFQIEKIKPYLFPMSSMTEEEKEEYCQLQQRIIYNSKRVVNEDVAKYINWCYKKHLDINNLIPMGLAIDATNLNIY